MATTPAAPQTLCRLLTLPLVLWCSGSTRGSGALVPSPVLDIARFDALVAQVDQLTKLLAEQTALNLKLQQQLSDALAQQANLNL